MSSKQFKVPVGLVNLDSDPSSGREGDLYYNTVSDVIRLYKNGAWTDLISSGNLPSGGATGQILAKASNTDYAVEWIENYSDYTETLKHRVKNDGTRALYQGQPVYVTGADGTNVLIGRSSNATEGGSSKTFGLLAQNLATNGQGFVISRGKLGGLDTSAAGSVGDPVWLGVDGELIYGLSNKPAAPAHLVYIGFVTKKNGSTGEIFVNTQNGFELEELHNVGIGYGVTPTDNELLAYDDFSGLWINQTAVEAGLIDTSSTAQTKAGDLTIGGNLIVNGTTTTVNTEQLNIEDNIITLNYGTSGSPSLNAGLEVERGTSDNTSIIWNETDNQWTLTNDGIIYNPIATQNGYTYPGNITIRSYDGIVDGSVKLETYQNSIQLTDDDGFVIKTGGATKTLTIDNLGHIVFPDASSQTTAFLGMSSYNTDDVAEGSTNKYFSNSAVQSIVESYGYITSSTASSTYLTQSSAASTYQLIGSYLTSETDPIFTASEAYTITSTDTSHWDTAYGWGDHSLADYLKSSTAASTYQPIGSYITSTSTSTLTNKTIGDALVFNNGGTNQTIYAGGQDFTIYGDHTVYINTVSGNIDLQPAGTAQIWGSAIATQSWVTSQSYSTTSHNHTVDSLSNVVITSPTDGQALVWDTTTSKWINETISGGASYPTQTSNSGKLLQTDGTNVLWADIVGTTNQINITKSSSTYGDITLSIPNDLNLGGSGNKGNLWIGNSTYNDALHLAVDNSNIAYLASLYGDVELIPATGYKATVLGYEIATQSWVTSQNYLTSYTETQTLNDVTTLGGTTSNAISITKATGSTSTTSGAFTVTGGAGIGENLYVGGNLDIAGNFTVHGTTTTVETSNLEVTDPLIYIATGNSANINDIGIVGHFDNGTYQHTGLVRDASDAKWKLFSGVADEPSSTINFTGATYDILKIGSLEVTDASTTRSNLGLGTMAVETASNYLTTSSASSTYAPIASPTFTGTVAGITKSMVGLGNVENTALSTWTGSSNITDLGTIASGTWQGTKIAADHGGTGNTSYTAGDILYASGSNTLSTLSATTDGYVLTLASGIPTWAAASGGSSFTDSAGLRALLSDETGTGSAVFATSPTFSTSLTIGTILNITHPYETKISSLLNDMTLYSNDQSSAIYLMQDYAGIEVGGGLNSISVTTTQVTLGGVATVDTLGNIAVNSLNIADVVKTGIKTTTISSTAATAIFTDTTAYSTIEYTIQAKVGSNYRSSKIMLVCNGTTTTSFTEYAILENSVNSIPVTFTATATAGVVTLNGAFTGWTAGNNITVKVVRTGIV